MSMVHKLRVAEGMSTEEAWKRYAALLETDGTDAKAVEKMREAMRTLGKSAADAAEDLETIAKARRLAALAAGLEEAERQEEATRVADVAYQEETLRIAEERRVGQAATYQAHAIAASQSMAAQRAVRDFEGMKLAHGPLLQHLALPAKLSA